MSECTKKYLLFLSFLTGAGVIAGGSNITHALTYQDTVDMQFTFNPTVSINVSGDLIIPNLTPGSAFDSNIITVKAGSNDANGYTLYSTVGSSTTNYTDLRIDSSNTTNVFTNLSSSKASLESFDDNTWGYSYCNTTNDCDTNTNWVSGNAGSTAAGYNGLPLYNASDNTTGVMLANTTSPSETELKFKIGAKAASTQATGTYTNTINFIGVAKVITTTYTLSYVDNSGEATNMPASATTGTTTTGAFNITDTAPTRANYIFKGWCTATTNDDTCSGNIIKPGGLYVIGDNPTTFSSSVYAMWKKPPCSASPMISTVASGITYMQDITSSNRATVLASLTTNATYQIKDNRDNETYCVSKLADGNLWMLDNLALDLTNSTVLNAMNESNTNASSTTLGYLKNGGGTTSDKYAITGVVNWTDSPTYASSYSYSDPLVNMASKDVIPTDATSTAGGYKIGGYYNYCAASAGSYCYGNGTSYGTSSGNATEDICPAGWRMPTGSTSGEFSALANAIYGSTSSTSDATAYANYRSALHLPLSGYFRNGSPNVQGSSGSWWSSTRNNNYFMYILDVYTSTIHPASSYNRYYGISLRCMAGS